MVRRRWDGRRRFSPGAAMGGGFRILVRGFPVAIIVVLVFMAPILFTGRFEFRSWVEFPGAGDAAITSFLSTAAVTWFGAGLVFEFSENAGTLSVAGLLGLALCYAATGVVAGLLHHRFTDGRWRGTSLAAVGRLGVLAVLAAVVLCLAKAMLAYTFVGRIPGHGLAPYAPVVMVAAVVIEVWFYARHCLALPVVAIERVPVLAALRRSRQLTSRAPLSMFAILVLLGVIQYLLFWLQQGLDLMPHRSFMFTVAPVAAITTALQAAFGASCYLQLSEIHDGPAARDLERVFE